MILHSAQPSSFNQLQTALKKKRLSERYIKRLAVALFVVLLLGSFYFLSSPPSSISWNQILLGLAIFWLGLIPSFEYLLNHKRPPIPFMPLVGIFYATSFGLPMFAADKEVHTWSHSDVIEYSLMLVLIGLALMQVAFYFSKSILFKKVSKICISGGHSAQYLLRLAWVFLLAHLIYLYFPAIAHIPSLGQLLRPIGYISYGLFYLLWANGRLKKTSEWLPVVLLLPASLLPLVASGSLAQILLVSLFMLIVFWHINQRVPFALIALVLTLYLFLSPVKIQYRYQTWLPNSNITLIDKISLFSDLAIKYHSSDVDKSVAQNQLIARSAHILVFSNVVSDTPEIIPYWQGHTYMPIFSKFIPRVLWPNKPTETVGNDFGRRYHYLGSADQTTSFNLPILVEMYVNFGELGVVCGMSLLGALTAFLSQKFNQSGMNSLEFLVGNTCLFSLIYQESNFSLLFGNVLILSIVLILLLRLRSQQSVTRYVP